MTSLVPTAGVPRDVMMRAETVIQEAHALVQRGDPFAGLQLAAHAQKALKIYARVLAEAKIAGRTANWATATRLKAERIAGEALAAIDREQGKRNDRTSRHGGTKFKEACEENSIAPRTAQRWQTVAEVPPEKFDAYVAQVDRERELSTSELLRTHVAEMNRQARVERLDLIARGGEPLAAVERYPVLYVDPPWQYEHVKTESRAIENQYPTMPLEAICALPVADLTTSDAVMFLWATSPKLLEALQVLEAWSFTYRTNLVWVKDAIGMGYWARQQHELLLVATRGQPPTPSPETRPSSVIMAPRLLHSAKPPIVYELIDRMFPTLPKMELFARSAREGWDRWGNETAALTATSPVSIST